MTSFQSRLAAWLLLMASTSLSAAQPPSPPPPEADRTPQPRGNVTEDMDLDERALFDAFSQTFMDAVLIGHFTVVGDRQEALHEERYEIRRATKMGAGDYWLFHARIKYGEHDVTVPLPLQVKWADKTPVITVDNVTIPALGTFDARVLIDGDRYAGTWSHGKVRGHLFGRIERSAPAGPETKDNAKGP